MGQASRLSPRYPSRLKASERRARAVELRCAGLTFDAIGKELGITRQGVQKHLDAVLDAHAATITEHAERLRALQLERIEAGIRGLWPSYSRGDYGAVDRMVKLLQRQAALLGLDLKPPDVTVDASQNVIVLPAWGEQAPVVDGEATETGLPSGITPPDASSARSTG
jgi:hypothetical protein